ncbi:hypothetical protein BpHYR1_019787 [Brachionus plicatilis]|uniref:Uncharacterized protein n=1 Tax=Brachionus plicatilis TaxID=10195 RepID=A0A3M7QM13_BRAPC|nr:hypothetical protein BpHYR1_019787 [Brachionus plicatilis]
MAAGRFQVVNAALSSSVACLSLPISRLNASIFFVLNNCRPLCTFIGTKVANKSLNSSLIGNLTAITLAKAAFSSGFRLK